MFWFVVFKVASLSDAASFHNHINLLHPGANPNSNQACIQCNSLPDHCWNCYSLEHSLAKANQLKSSAYIQVQSSPDPFPLKQSITLQDVSSITLSATTLTATITCTDSVGLSFNRSSNIRLENLKFVGCGGMQYSTTTVTPTTNDFIVADFKFVKVPVSLYFLSCSNVSIERVTVKDAPGTGLVLYNTGGKSVISNTLFSSNGKRSEYSCGGVIVEQSLCIPGDHDMCVTPNQSLVSGAEFIIVNSSFVGNLAGGEDISPVHNSGKDYQFEFGKGNGLSIVLKGEAKNNTVTLSNLNFANNTAQYGGGSLYVAFLDNAESNTLSMTNTHITNSHSLVESNSIADIVRSSAQGPAHTNFSCPNCSLTVDQNHGISCSNPDYCNFSFIPPTNECPVSYSIRIGKSHCWNYVDDMDTNSSVLSQFIGGMCPYNYRSNFCEPINHFTHDNYPPACPANRYGRLCGKCDDNHGIAINTGDMECITCYFPELSTWFLYLAIEFTYATILFLVVILTKLSLNAGGTSAFIFYCQVITMKFPGLSYPSWVLEDDYDYNYKYTIARGFTVIYSIANLDFVIPFADPFCLSKNLTPAQAILLEYMPAVYLLFLTFLVYSWVLLYSRHCNIIYRLTNIITKNDNEAVYNRKGKYRPNYYESLAVIVILCYTRIATTSAKFLHGTNYYNLKGEKLGRAFFYDGTLDYFGNSHAVYATIASLILVTCIFLPAVFLTVHPLIQTYILPKVRLGASPIDTKSFTSSFKNGTSNSIDHRYFAGVYLFLRIVIAFLYLQRDIESLLISQISVAIVAASLFLTIRPYKVDIYNTIDGLFFVYLSLLSGLSANGYYSVCQEFLIHVPLLVIFLYVIYRCVLLLRRFKLRNVRGQPLMVIDTMTDSDEVEPLLSQEDNSNVFEGLFNQRLLEPQVQPIDRQNKRTVALHDMSS